MPSARNPVAPLHTAALLLLAAGCSRHAVVEVRPGESLDAALAGAPDRATVMLHAGRHHLEGAGLLGKSLNIMGSGRDETFIDAGAEGGFHFTDSLYSALQDLTVTAVTVERGQLTLVHARVTGGGSAISGRSGSRLILRNSEVAGGHDVGVALEEDSAGTVEGSLVDGNNSPGGVGLSIGPHARLSVLNTVIRRHARALSIAPDAYVEIHGNLIEDSPAPGLDGSGPNWRVDDNFVWMRGVSPDKESVRRICANLPALPYGADSAFYGTFCRGGPGRT